MPLKNPEVKPDLQSTIDQLIVKMEKVEPQTEEYATMADQLVKLYELKEVDSKIRVSRDTLVSVGAQLIIAILIIRHERENVITTKVMQIIRDFRTS